MAMSWLEACKTLVDFVGFVGLIDFEENPAVAFSSFHSPHFELKQV